MPRSYRHLTWRVRRKTSGAELQALEAIEGRWHWVTVARGNGYDDLLAIAEALNAARVMWRRKCKSNS